MAIDIPVTFGDIEGAIRGMERLSGTLSDGAKSAEDFAKQQERTVREMAEFSGRVAAVGGQIANFGRIIENDAIAKIGDLTNRVAQSYQQWSEMGRILGPQGAVVAGIAGALLPIIGDLYQAIEEVDQRNEAWAARLREIEDAQARTRSEIERTTRAIGDQSEAVLNAARDMREFISGLSRAGLQGQAMDAAAQVAVLSDQLAEVNDEIASLGGATGASAALRLLDLRERAAELTTQIVRLSEDAAEGNRLAEEGTNRTREAQERLNDALEQELAFYDRLQTAEENLRRVQEERLRKEIESLQAVTAAREAAVQRELEDKAAIEAAEAEGRRRAEEQRQAEARELEQVFALREQMESERSEKLTDELDMAFEVGTRVTETLGAAIGDVVSGAKTSEEAFHGLLKSFLEMISEYSALMAAKEYAEAIASAAINDWAGFGQHVAAGVAFTAVAVATGVGAAAVNTKPTAAPEEPQRTSQGGGQGGDIIINWNSPVVTTGTRAQLGREMRGMIREAEVRGI